MYLDYNGKKTEITFNQWLENVDFMRYLTFLKLQYIPAVFDKNSKLWVVNDNRLEEFLHFLQRSNLKYEYSEAFYHKLISLQKEKENIKPALKINRGFKIVNFSKYLKEGSNLEDFQNEGVYFALRRNVSINSDETGAGKTFQGMAWLSYLLNENRADKVIILVRNTLVYDWKKEILLHCIGIEDEDIQLIDAKKKITPYKDCKDKKVIIVSNTIFAHTLASYKPDYDSKKKLSKLKWNKPYVDLKLELGVNKLAVIIDEVQDFENPESTKNKAFCSINNHFAYKLFLSATIGTNYFERWFGIFRMLDEGVLKGKTYNLFKIGLAEYMGNKFDPLKIVRYNTEAVNDFRKKIISKYAVKRLKTDLPSFNVKKFIKTTYFEMTDAHDKLYRSFMKEEIKKLVYDKNKEIITLKDIINRFSYYLQIIENPLLLDGKLDSPNFSRLLKRWKIEDDCRYQYLKERIPDIINNNDSKVIIFDNHPKTLDVLADKFKEYNPLVLHGANRDSMEERQRKKDLFNDPYSKHKLILVGLAVGGVGLNLNQGSNHAIYWSLPYDGKLYIQSQDRIFRLNNTRDAYIEILLIDNTIDVVRYKIVKNRDILNNAIFDKELDVGLLEKLMNGNIKF